MPVAGASVVDTNSTGSIPAASFLNGISDAGAASAMDAISMHAYPGSDLTGGRAVRTVETVRAWRDSAGDPASPIWITETGASTTGPGAVPETLQGAVVENLNRRLGAERGVEMLLFHTLLDTTADPAYRETGYGVARADFTPKPAGCVLAIAWGGLGSCPASLLG
jgi:hypothetical protein